jgi:hypothetical protein
MIYQVCQANPTLTPIVNQKYKSCLGRIYNSHHPHPCGEILEALLNGDQLAYMILDGLDECAQDERKQLMETILELGCSCPNLHILVSGRKETDITETLEPKAAVVTVEENNKLDIMEFVTRETEDLWDRVKDIAQPGTHGFFQDLAAKIVFQANGIYGCFHRFSATGFY